MFDILKNLWGSRRPERIREQLVSEDPTKGYMGGRQVIAEHLMEGLPPFTLIQTDLMALDPVVQFGLNVRDGALRAAEINVTSRTPAVREYIGRQWSLLWSEYSRFLLRTKVWGYAGFQVLYRENDRGELEIDSLKDFSPYDIRPLRDDRGVIVGIAVKPRRMQRDDNRTGNRHVLMPRGLYTTFGTRWSNPWGRSILRQSYSSWWEKWMTAGVRDMTRLRMLKDAWRGDFIQVPFQMNAELPDGTVMPWRDIGREFGENMRSGGLGVLPTLVDQNGNKLVDYSPPVDTGNPTAIWEWGKQVDRDIWRGMDVFEEVIQASETGSGYAGRSVPLIMFLSAVTGEFEELLEGVDRMVLRPMACLQFGRDVEYRISVVPLVDTFAKDVQGSAMGGSAMGGGASQPAQSEAPAPGPQAQPGAPAGFPQQNGAAVR